MKFSRINLLETNYRGLRDAKLLEHKEIDVGYLQNIYKQYCVYKKFSSVMPLFESEFYNNDVIAYYDQGTIQAFSMIGVYDNKNVENFQFAWTYHKPEMQLGIKSLEHECAHYKALGYDYLYLGGPDNYKQKFAGFEILGPA